MKCSTFPVLSLCSLVSALGYHWLKLDFYELFIASEYSFLCSIAFDVTIIVKSFRILYSGLWAGFLTKL